MEKRATTASGVSHRFLTCLLVAALAMTVLVSGAGAQEDDSFQWRGALENGDFLEVRGISGDIRAVAASGSEAEVLATKHGRERDFDFVEIVMFEERGGVVVCAVYGERRRRDSCDNDDNHDWNRGRRRNIRVSVDFEVRVPAGVDLIAATVSGHVDAESLRSDVEASSVSGDVFVSTTGVARASTVSGRLDIEMGTLDWDWLSYHTVSGDITLRVPDDLDAEIDFESLSGDFRTDFDLEVTRRRDRFVGSELSGRIGSGNRSLKFKTISGDVRLERATSRR